MLTSLLTYGRHLLGGMVCYGALLFFNGCTTDGGCTLDIDCGSGERCVHDTNTCELAPECKINADCEGAQQCFPGEGETGALCRLPTTCNESDDVNLYCREKNGAMGAEQYTCNSQNDKCRLESAVCEDDEDCVDALQKDLQCLASLDASSTTDVCRTPQSCGEARDVNDFCRRAMGQTTDKRSYACEPSLVEPARAICVEIKSLPSQLVLIRDVTTVDCDLAEDINGFDPGSDITFVELRDADDMTTLGWGKTVKYTPGDTQNDFDESSVLDGLAPDLITMGEQEDIDNRCPAPTTPDSSDRFRKETVLTLGCMGASW